jgi:diguanylate cyclase (GGDEF)-like protein
MGERDNVGEKRSDLIISPSQVLATRSASLLRRSLARISSAEMAGVLRAAKHMTPCHGNVFDSIWEEVANVLHPDRWALLLRDLETDELFFQIATDGSNDPLKAPWKLVPERLNSMRIKAGRGIIGSVAEAHEPVVVSDVRADSRFLPEIDGWPDVDITSIVAIPLRPVGPICLEYRERCVGLIELINYTDQQGTPQTDLSIIQELADFAAIAIGNSRHVQAIHALTITDEITGLYNLRHLSFMLDAEIYRSARYDYTFSLVALDVKDFASLSASHSWASINQLIRAIAQNIRTALRLIDFAFRCGDSEFIVLLPQASNERAGDFAALLKERVASALSGYRDSGISVGSVTFPSDGKTKSELLANVHERLRSGQANRTR